MQPIPRFQVIAAMPPQERDRPSPLVKAFGLLSLEWNKTLFPWTRNSRWIHDPHLDRDFKYQICQAQRQAWPVTFTLGEALILAARIRNFLVYSGFSPLSWVKQPASNQTAILRVNFRHGLPPPRLQFFLPIQGWHHHHGKSLLWQCQTQDPELWSDTGDSLPGQ